MSLTCVGLAILVIAAASGCSNTATGPTPAPVPANAPSPAPAAEARGLLVGFVVERTGACVNDATVEIVGGQGVGQRVTQMTPCGVWDYGGGFVFNDLALGEALTVRATAPGYRSAERTFLPLSTSGYRAVSIVLDTLQ